MRSLKWIVVGLLLVQASVVKGQALEVVSSSPNHGSTLAPIDATVSFTFSEPVDFDPATYLVSWSGTFADRGQPFRRDPYLSDGGQTLNFPVVHRANSDYVWYIYGVYVPNRSNPDSAVQHVVPFVISYTTGEQLGTASLEGRVTMGSDVTEEPLARQLAEARIAAPPLLRSTGLSHEAETRSAEPTDFGVERLLGLTELQSRLMSRIRQQPAGRIHATRDRTSGVDVHPSSAATQFRTGSAADHALVLLEGASNQVAGGAAVDLADGSYRIDYVRAGTYLPFVTQVLPGSGGQISRIGFYDPDDDRRPDSLHVDSTVSAVDLTLHDLSFYALTGREAEATLSRYAESQYPDLDLDLVSLETFTYSLSGRSVVWRAVYYSASRSLQVIADWTITSVSAYAYSSPLPEWVRPIDENYLDSDAVAEAFSADASVSSFMTQHPEPMAGVFFTAGDYQFALDDGTSPSPERQLWRIKYEVDLPNSRPSLTAYLDIGTGEIVQTDVFEPLPPATARSFEPTAAALASERVDDPSALQLFRVASLEKVAPATGATDSWRFEYYSAASGVVSVELTPFGHTAELDPWTSIPEDAPRVPASFVDSDVAVALAENRGGADFRRRYGGGINLEGGYVQQLAVDDPDLASRPIWSILYEGDAGGSMSFLIDMESGDLLATEVYEPLQPASARTHENRAFELVSERASDPSTLRLYQIRAAGGSDLDSLLFHGVSSSWSYSYISPSEGLFVIHLGPSGYHIQTDPTYRLPDGAPVVPDEYVDSDSMMATARAAGGSAFLDEFLEADVYLEGGYAASYRFEFPEYATVPVWAVRYSAFDGSTLTVFVDMVSGELLETAGYRPRRAATAADAQLEALRIASEQAADSARPELFRIFATIEEPLDGTSTTWHFSYLHPETGRIDVSLFEYEYTVQVDSSYRHPEGAPLVPGEYVDSDDALRIAEGTADVQSFREEFGHDRLLIEGGYAEELGYGEPLRASRALWILQYVGEGSEPPPTLNVVLDMQTGELLDSNVSSDRSEENGLPRRVALHPNYPNPFNPATSIQYDLPAPMDISLTIYDALGREVVTLVDGLQTAGRHTVTWEAGAVSSGLYLARLKAGGATEVQSMLLQK